MTVQQTLSHHSLHCVSKVPNPRILFVASVVFSTYCLFATYVIVVKNSACYDRETQDYDDENMVRRSWWDSLRPFENDILLEYKSTSNNEWNDIDCRRYSCTRIFVNGTRLGKLFKYSTEINLPTQTSLNLLDIDTDLLLATTAATETENKIESVSPSYNLMTCEDISRLWSDPEFLSLEIDSPISTSGIVIKQGPIKKFFHPHAYQITTQEAYNNCSGYFELQAEYKKRSLISWNMKGVQEMLGVCLNAYYVRFVFITLSGENICKTLNEAKQTKFNQTDCYRLTKLHEIIKSQEDSTLATLQLLQSFVCFVAELEKRKLFVEDLHGSQLSLSLSDMSITLNNLKSIFHYGERNILGGSICIKDADCPRPTGAKWYNDSTNQILYARCHDIQPTCIRNRCVGFNASLHLCGITNFLVKRFLRHIHLRISRPLGNYVHYLANPYAEARKSGEDACTKISSMLSQYKFDKENKSDEMKVKYHTGKRSRRKKT